MKYLLLITLLITLPVFAQPIYTEKETYQVEVLEDGQLQVRKATRIYKDGVEISKTYHRHVVTPDVSEEILDKQPARVKTIANAVWTEKVKNDYEAEKVKRERTAQ